MLITISFIQLFKVNQCFDVTINLFVDKTSVCQTYDCDYGKHRLHTPKTPSIRPYIGGCRLHIRRSKGSHTTYKLQIIL